MKISRQNSILRMAEFGGLRTYNNFTICDLFWRFICGVLWFGACTVMILAVINVIIWPWPFVLFHFLLTGEFLFAEELFVLPVVVGALSLVAGFAMLVSWFMNSKTWVEFKEAREAMREAKRSRFCSYVEVE